MKGSFSVCRCAEVGPDDAGGWLVYVFMMCNDNDCIMLNPDPILHEHHGSARHSPFHVQSAPCDRHSLGS